VTALRNTPFSRDHGIWAPIGFLVVGVYALCMTRMVLERSRGYAATRTPPERAPSAYRGHAAYCAHWSPWTSPPATRWTQRNGVWILRIVRHGQTTMVHRTSYWAG